MASTVLVAAPIHRTLSSENRSLSGGFFLFLLLGGLARIGIVTGFSGILYTIVRASLFLALVGLLGGLGLRV